MEGRGREPITAKDSTEGARLWLSPLQNHIAPGLAPTGCAEAPGVQRAAWVNRTSKVHGHLSFLLLLVPAALPQFPAPSGQFMSPRWVIHPSAFEAPPLPEPTSVAASRAQLHITSSSFSCSNPVWFALMQEKSCTKLLRNRPLRLFPATSELFETLHQDLPVLLSPCAPILLSLSALQLLRFLQHPATHPELLGGGSNHCSPEFPPSTFSARLQHGKSSPVAEGGSSSSCCTFKKNEQIPC